MAARNRSIRRNKITDKFGGILFPLIVMVFISLNIAGHADVNSTVTISKREQIDSALLERLKASQPKTIIIKPGDPLIISEKLTKVAIIKSVREVIVDGFIGSFDKIVEFVLTQPAVETVSVRDQEISSAQLRRLARAPELSLLNLLKCGIYDNERIKSLAHLGQLHTLGLQQNPITDGLLDLLEGCSSLKVLNLSRTKVTHHAPEHLSRNRKLEAITVDESVSDRIFLQALLKFPRIAQVHCSDPFLTDADTTGLTGLDNLKYVDFSKTHISNVTVGRLLDSKESISYLDVSENHIGNDASELISKFRWLKVLDVSGTKIACEAILFDNLQELSSLDLSRIEIDGNTMREISRLPHLKRLVLDNTRINRLELSYLRASPLLEELSIRDCPNLQDLPHDFFSDFKQLRIVRTENRALNEEFTRSLLKRNTRD